MQEYPPLPELAFQYGGATFFDPEVLRLTTIEINSPQNTYVPRFFRFKFGKNILETEVTECEGREGLYHLAIWEPPRAGDGVVYSIGVDPAYGMNEKSDYACIQLLRCYEDGMEQVAEFAAKGLTSMHLGWAVLYLFGAYHLVDDNPNVIWNTEIQGGGAAVIQTIEQIQQDIGGFYDRVGLHFDPMRAYAYKRVDSLQPNYTAKHSHINATTRDQYFHQIKSYFEAGMLKIRSLNLLGEMSRMIRSPGGTIESSEGKHDDLLCAMSMAVMNYWDPIRYDLEGSGYSIRKWEKEREVLLNGATGEDLLMMRISSWLKDRRDLFREREQDLSEMRAEYEEEIR